MVGRHPLVVRNEARVRMLQPVGQRCRDGRVEPFEAEGRQFGCHRVGADGQRPPVGRRLDGGVAEALPERGEQDGVTGGVGVGDGAATGRRPAQDAATGSGDEALELGSVAVLGGSEEPVGGVERIGQGNGSAHVLAGQGAGGLQQQRRPVGNAQGLAHAGPFTRCGIRIEGVVDRRGGYPADGQLGAAQLVDGHVGPRGVVRRRREMRQLGALPGQVMVMQERRTSGAGRRHDGRRSGVQGERAEVLDDDQVGAGQRRVDLRPGRWFRRVHGQPR